MNDLINLAPGSTARTVIVIVFIGVRDEAGRRTRGPERAALRLVRVELVDVADVPERSPHLLDDFHVFEGGLQ